MKQLLLLAILCALSAPINAAEWTGQGEAGLVKTSGNTDSENANIGLAFTNEGELWTHDLSFKLFQNSSDGVDTAESLSAAYIAKRALSERRYIFAGLNYLDDDFDGFTEQSSVSIGYGYHVFDTEKVGFELAAGLGYRDTNQLIILTDGSEVEGQDLSGATLVLLSKYRNKLTANTEFVDDFRAEIGSDNTFFQNDAALIVSMNERFSLKAGILTRHNTDPAPGADETDTVTSFNLLYNF